MVVKKKLRVTGYCDASWQTYKDDSRSQSSWVFLLNGRAVTWKSLKQDTLKDFTCESEYISGCEASKEAIWMMSFIRDLGVVLTVKDHIEIFCDNESVFALTKEPKNHGKYGYQEKDKNKDKTGRNRAREWKEREKTSSTVPSLLIGPKKENAGPSVGSKMAEAQKAKAQQKNASINIEMEPDIENMTMSEYLEYEAAKERRLWDDVRSRRSPTHCDEADFSSFH
ncbi:hypothetical protein Tco_0935365 [Tanacetum coccineum]